MHKFIKQRKLVFFSFFLIFLFTAWGLEISFAFEFNPNNIISDETLFDKDGMTLEEIQGFLEKNQSILAEYSSRDVDGKTKQASEIIYDAAERSGVNPKFILTKLDHEQALIRKHIFVSESSKARALKWATGFSACDGCTANEKYAGFANQVDALASVQKDYIRKQDRFGIQIGKPFVTRDGFTVTPENNATRNLYIYTPWHGGKNGIGGNHFFARLWNKYFGKQKYPDGVILKDEGDNLWLIKNGERRRYASRATFLANRDIYEAIAVNERDLNDFSIGPDIKVANYSLLQTPDAKKYLIVNEEARPIKDDETFRFLGFNPEELVNIGFEELNAYEIGYPIGPGALFPTGALVKAQGGKEIYWVQDGRRHIIQDDSIYKVNFKNQTLSEVESAMIESLIEGEPIKFKDGSLVRSPKGELYIISNGMKLPIDGAEALIGLLGNDKLLRVADVSAQSLDMHTTGDPIVYLNPSAVKKTQEVSGDILIDYLAIWEATRAPKTLLEDEEAEISVSFRNVGAKTWKRGDIVLKITDENGGKTPLKSSDFADEFGSIPMKDDAAQSSVAEFRFHIKGGPLGKHSLQMQIARISNTGDDAVKGGGLIINTEVIPSEYSARIVKSKFPIAAKNTWKTVQVQFTLKNTGKKPWTRGRAAIKVLSQNGEKSVLYDPKDWVNDEIAAVSLKPMTAMIKTGQEALYSFTLKVKGLRPGAHVYKMQLILKDQNDQIVFLNSAQSIVKQIRIDK